MAGCPSAEREGGLDSFFWPSDWSWIVAAVFASRSRSSCARVSLGRVSLSAVSLSVASLSAVLAACTLDNSVHDTDQNAPPPNAWRDSPDPGSVTLFQNPGDNLLSAIVEMEKKDKNAVQVQFNRMLGVALAEAGAYTSAISTYQPFGTALQNEAMFCQNSDLPDAVEELCARLQDDPDDPEDQDFERLVFMNTMQHTPAQTTLARKLLSCLKDAGFQYLAVEALGEDAAALVARGYVSRTQSGPFAREPQMARLLEDGLRLGFDIVNFDVSDHCLTCAYTDEMRDHGEEQARNLVARTLGVDPDAKVFVLAGPRQSYKQPWGPNLPYSTSLANRVWMQTQIEPYAIEQVEIDLPAMPFGASSPSPPSGMYMASGPDNGQCMGQYTPRTENGRPALDTVMVHVPPHTDAQRWDWLHAPAEERRSLTPGCASCTSGQRLLVQAFPGGVDTSDAVPTDQALCAAGVECQLVLPAGPYQVVVWSESARLGSTLVDLSTAAGASVAL
jgi:hypothetical protein